MAAYRTPTVGTRPGSILLFKEGFNAVRTYEKQILNHAHMILSPVPVVKGFEALAWKAGTFITEANETFSEGLAPVTHMQAVLAPGQTALTVHTVESPCVQIVRFRQITDAQSAVHSAGGDKLLFRLGHRPDN